MLLRVCSFRRRIFPRFLFTKQDEIFVSKYSRVDPKERDSLLHMMEGEGNKVRSAAQGKFEVMECRLCDKGNKSNADNLWKLL